MPAKCFDSRLKTGGVQRSLRGSFTLSIMAGRVAVLLVILGASGGIHRLGANDVDPLAFDFTADVFTPMGRSHFRGLMATDGSRHRIALYWAEPGRVRDDAESLITCCDILFSEESAYYWVHSSAETGVLRRSGSAKGPLVPQEADVQSVLCCVLRTVDSPRSLSKQNATPLHLHEFLRNSRLHPEYTYGYRPEEGDDTDLFRDSVTDRQVLNALPLGREYVKGLSDDGTLQWRLSKALDHKPVIRVRIGDRIKPEEALGSKPFDANSLGQWQLVPEPYRVYWSFRTRYSELRDSTQPSTQAIDVCHRVKGYLDTKPMPDPVRRALERLWFDMALVTGDFVHTRESLQATVTGLCQDDTVSNDRVLLEFGTMAEALQSHWPKQSQALLKTCVERIVELEGQSLVESFSRHIKTFNRHQWFSYGDLLLEALRQQPSINASGVKALAANYAAARLSREKQAFDASQACASVRQYLLRLDDDPPPGGLTLDDLRHVLKQGLARHHKAGDAKTPSERTENVVRSIRLIVGEGPFRANRAELFQSLERFSSVYFDIARNKGPIDMTLATFLALSFCDISTARDHDALCAQIARLSTRFQARLNTSLHAHGVHSLVGPEDVKGLFHQYYEQAFRGYVADPLCPAFKFPLTANEEVRLINELIQKFDRLKPFLEEVSLKVKYGGLSEKLKRRAISGISPAVQNVLPSMAFLRRPSYPGVTCVYRGRHGFATVIPETIYQEGRRPKERFQAMQYFHLGHRIEDIVKREQALLEQEHQRGRKQ